MQISSSNDQNEKYTPIEILRDSDAYIVYDGGDAALSKLHF